MIDLRTTQGGAETWGYGSSAPLRTTQAGAEAWGSSVAAGLRTTQAGAEAWSACLAPPVRVSQAGGEAWGTVFAPQVRASQAGGEVWIDVARSTLPPPPATPTLDGSGTGIASNLSQVSASLTTTRTNDIICAVAYVEKPGGPPAMLGVSAPGLIFSRRAATPIQTTPAQGQGVLELWWAVASAPLSAVPITAAYASSFDDAALLVFGASGCDPASPWDADPSLPALYAGDGGAAFPFISTQGPALMIFGQATSNPWTADRQGPPVNFSLVGQALNPGAIDYANLAVAAEPAARQSSATFNWHPGITRMSAILDALAPGTGAGPPPPAAGLRGFAVIMS